MVWRHKFDESSTQTDSVAGSSETENRQVKCSRRLALLSVAQHVTDLLDIQFRNDENSDGSWNIGLFAFQPPDAAGSLREFYFSLA
jgi:hypothetical protein